MNVRTPLMGLQHIFKGEEIDHQENDINQHQQQSVSSIPQYSNTHCYPILMPAGVLFSAMFMLQ